MFSSPTMLVIQIRRGLHLRSNICGADEKGECIEIQRHALGDQAGSDKEDAQTDTEWAKMNGQMSCR